jgi:hypothetical protein
MIEVDKYKATRQFFTETLLGSNVYGERYQDKCDGMDKKYERTAEEEAGEMYRGKLCFKNGVLLRFFPRVFFVIFFVLV